MTTIPLSSEDILNHKNLKNIISDNKFRIAIFGSARIKQEDEQYQSIIELAKQLAIKGYDIVTGGGPGAMEAASLGHQIACDNCDHTLSSTIGINIELPFEQKPNQYLDITETVSTFSARLDTFMVLSNIFVITSGGIWTLLELFYTWQLMQVGHICRAPIILWWEEYKGLKDFINDSVLKSGFINQNEADLAIQVDTLEEVLTLINKASDTYKKSENKACINITQYLAGAKNLWLVD